MLPSSDLVGFILALTLVVAACGGSDDGAAPPEPPAEAAPEPESTTEPAPAPEPAPEPAPPPAGEAPSTPEPSPPPADDSGTASPLDTNENRDELRTFLNERIAEEGWAGGCIVTDIAVVLGGGNDTALGLGDVDQAVVGRSPQIIDPAADELVWIGWVNLRGYAGPEITELEEIEGDDYYCLRPPLP